MASQPPPNIRVPRAPQTYNANPEQPPSSTPSPKVVKDGFGEDDFATVKLSSFKIYAGEETDYRPSCWSRFKVLIWSTLAVCVVAAVIAIAVIMTENGSPESSSSSGVAVPTPPGAPPSRPGEGAAASLTPDVIADIEENASDKDGTLPVMANPPFRVPPGYTALWWDEFNGDSLDLRWWNYQYGYGAAEGLWQWGNREEQYYTDSPSNVRVSDGTLKITAIREPTVLQDGYTFNYTSGRINTKGKAGFFGGMKTKDGKQWNNVRIEARIKAPQPTTGTWAAYWMLPIDLRYGVWASSGEIDVYEMKNNFIRNNMALHYGGPWPKYSERFNTYERRPGGGSFSDDFTVVTMDWTPTQINMYMDGELAFSDKSKAIDPNGWYSKSLNGAWYDYSSLRGMHPIAHARSRSRCPSPRSLVRLRWPQLAVRHALLPHRQPGHRRQVSRRLGQQDPQSQHNGSRLHSSLWPVKSSKTFVYVSQSTSYTSRPASTCSAAPRPADSGTSPCPSPRPRPARK